MEPKERYYEKRVEKYVTKGFKIFFAAIFFIGLVLLAGYVMMLLWNWLMPDLFGLTTIGYWQALGIMLLAKIIFGFGNHSSKKSNYKSKKRHSSDRFCRTKKEFSKWQHYDQFWKEEGEDAYNAYLERIQKEKSNESAQEN
ncbi:hypothetical protein [Flagellimonas flava]|uniref:Uncharacterized protein n=1 Tax=Flagellimonas flava TaxID=570519 RepID=A0A1M5MF12_9FLAO|nr:hypothetical protein [Allomuricauda flava]SHG75895.1 hypothetical protein SAMN04488116_2419 [Allomuricauda flava]